MKKDKYIIGCMPLYASLYPPKGQIGCILMPCPKCFIQMWVSQSKRNIMTANSPLNPDLMCFTCIAKHYPDDMTKAEHLDISKVKWMERTVKD